MIYTYIDENDFNKKVRSLKTYCPRAYKHYIFKIKDEILKDKSDGIYRRELITSDDFKFVYGKIELIYSVKNGVVILENIEPSQFLLDGYRSILDTYKGICYRDNKDKFKIDLLFSLKKGNYAI